ncbi:DUF3987 domain-containing protein [Bartonella krasnovii]|uniref:DUF3987 domain-containing protein n=1 Tax=Bartonella krasnovii TaxID=2267275 RepID=A0ABY3VWG7_9HYPH|nr:DUF3987 domain-containing protein [Bartonella krasnovii]UNF29718.1 DUF3987 domain-containing protein [Bartonella krasnovii]UNF36078.1 DUF3987 domain-containing protein [Bartonella krasnovii]UNF37733.1 DUF3987 domain-containing protein [Bartonella krasnovii]UNF41160.1 DUF3987 domain-containing protein [Bartonella krasnovii]UNF52621.1 DUF3987 domain-containing protein [Bartonella krasnovii]
MSYLVFYPIWNGRNINQTILYYLTAFNGKKSYTYDRIERGTISIIGGIQPSRIIPIIQDMNHGINGDALLQRFQMLVFPDERKELLWVDRLPNQKAWEIFQRTVKGGISLQVYKHIF